jgi:SAM-dependent methyltransferase
MARKMHGLKPERMRTTSGSLFRKTACSAIIRVEFGSQAESVFAAGSGLCGEEGTVDKKRVAEFAGTVYRDMAGAMTIGMAYLGARTGLFAALAKAGPVTSADLAEATTLQPRYVEEWLNGMTAAGWLEHDETAGTFLLPDEHAYLVASEGTDHYMGGLFLAGPSLLSQAPGVAQAFRDGGGVAFDAFGVDWIEAMDLMNGGAYAHRLASYWMAQVPDAAARLEAGGRALDVGCGVGRVALALAAAYPAAEVVGIDPDPGSIAMARQAAAEAGAERIRFIEGTISDLPGTDRYDFATLFDCLHDLTDPAATLAAIRGRISPAGALMVMEPKAADRRADNVNPLGAVYYGFSLFHCMTQSLAQGGPGLGTCLGPERTMALLREGGFSDVVALPIKSQINLFYLAHP